MLVSESRVGQDLAKRQNPNASSVSMHMANPNTTTSDVTLGLPAADNVVCVLFQEDQVAFAAGYAAAKVSKTGVVGGVFGAPLGPLLRFEMGYKSGARYADPDVVVETQYVHAFDTPDKGAEVAEFMVTQRNADVIFGAAGGTSLGTLNWCLSNQVLAIGVDQDQVRLEEELSDSKSITPPSYITSLERSDSSTDKRRDNMNNIPHRLSSRDSFSSSLRSSHIPPYYIINNLPLRRFAPRSSTLFTTAVLITRLTPPLTFPTF